MSITGSVFSPRRDARPRGRHRRITSATPAKTSRAHLPASAPTGEQERRDARPRSSGVTVAIM
eukprot:7227674-Pyramimonas_sp.AAC.1